MKVKQFKEVLSSTGQDRIFNNIVDEATQLELIDYFYYRYVCDESIPRFTKYFQRNLRRYKGQYEEYLRIQNTTFDPMVSRYLERRFKDKYERTDNGTEDVVNSSTANYTSDNTITNTGTIKDDREINTDGTTTNNLTETSNGSNSSNDKNSNVFSDMPQANVQSYTGQDIDTINMTYATNMTVGKNTHSGSDTNTTTDTGTITTENDTTDSSTQTQNLTRTSDTTYNGTNNGTRGTTTANNTNYGLEHKEVYTGRDGMPQEMLEKAREYIINTNAFNWLVGQLDKCFMSNFFYGEED